MKNVLSKVNPGALELAKTLGIFVTTLEEWQPRNLDLIYRPYFGDGFYDSKLDEIILLGNVYSPTLTLLHEIIHWTGRDHRLARRVIVEGRRLIISPPEEIALEEAVAQIGMFKLAKYLGLADVAAETFLRQYLGDLPPFDYKVAQAKAREAVNYVVSCLDLSTSMAA